MTDRLENAIRNGNRAAALLEDPLLNEIIDRLEQESIEALVDCESDDLSERRQFVVAIRKLRQCLKAYISNGKVAQHSLRSNDD